MKAVPARIASCPWIAGRTKMVDMLDSRVSRGIVPFCVVTVTFRGGFCSCVKLLACSEPKLLAIV